MRGRKRKILEGQPLPQTKILAISLGARGSTMEGVPYGEGVA